MRNTQAIGVLEGLEPRRLLAAVGPEPTGLAGLYHTTGLLSQSRAYVAVASYGDDVVFAGGEVTTRSGRKLPSDVADVYDSRTGQWSATKLIAPRLRIYPTVVGSVIVFPGGWTDDELTHGSNAVDLFDTATGRWGHIVLSRSPGSASISAVGSKVVIAGGEDAGGQPSAAVDIWDSATGQWSSATLSVARSGAATAVVVNRLILAGGAVPGGGSGDPVASDAVDVYDAATDQWTTARLSEPRGWGVTAAAVGSGAIVGGGSADDSIADVYDWDTGQWSTRTLDVGGASAGPLAFHAQTSDAYTFVVAGKGLNVYDATTGQWTSSTIPTDYRYQGPLILGAVGGHVALGASSSYDDQVRHVDVYDASSGQWSGHDLTDAHELTLAAGGRLVFAGGMMFDGGPESSNLIETYDPAAGTWSTTTLAEPIDGISPHGQALGTDDIVVATGEGAAVFDAATGEVTPLTLSPARYPGEFATAGGQLVTGGPEVWQEANAAVDLWGASALGEPRRPSVPEEAGIAAAPAALSWSSVRGATFYAVYLDDQFVGNVTEPRWVVDRPIADGPHAWQVVAWSNTGMTGGPRWAFTVGLPAAPTAPGVPDGAQLTVSPTALSWTGSAAATSYDVYLDGVHVERTTETSVPLDEPVAGGPHVWQVVAHNGPAKVASPAWTFSTPKADGLRHSSAVLSGYYAGQLVPALAAGRATVFADPSGNGRVFSLTWGRGGGWSEEELTANRSAFGTASVDGTVLFAGGDGPYGGQAVYDTVDLFDPATGAWSTAKLSQARRGAVGASAGDVAAFAGGSFGTTWTPSDVVDFYNGWTGAWSTGRLSQARDVAAAVSVGGRMLFAGGVAAVGGQGGTSQGSDAVDIYDTVSGQWSTAHLSQASESLTSFTVGTRAYFAGDSVMDVYDAATGAWDHVAVPQAMSAAKVAVAGRVVYFVTEPTVGADDVVSVFDTRTARWSTVALSSGRSGVSVAVAGDLVLFAGGILSGESGRSDATTRVVDVLDTRTGQWSVAKLAVGGYDLAAASVGDTAVFLDYGNYLISGTGVDYFTAG